MSEDVVIRVNNVSKDFLLPHERTQSLKAMFVNVLKGKRNKTVQKQHALKGVSFEVKKGEFFGIVGRNGSGKSTLLKILAQIYQPTKGSVQVNGRLVPFIELGVGFNPELTGRDNVYLSASLLGFSEREIDAMYNDIVEFAELEKFMDQKLKNYSSGMQVRLAFSVAVRADADVLLIDEVLAVGDADFQHKCFNYFRQLKNKQCTVIFVTHDMSAVREFCDRAVLISDGKVGAQGTPSKVADAYTKLFIDVKDAQSTSSSSRTGNGRVRIQNIKRVPPLSTKEHGPAVDFEILAKKDAERLIVGFRCIDSAGRPIIGTNTSLEGVSIRNMKEGDKKRITFQIPNIFNQGTYIFDLVVEDQSGNICDWVSDAITVQARTERKSGYLVEVPIATKVVDV